MSGLEIAGVILGAFPILISSLENWNNVARIGGYLWKVRSEYSKCRFDARYYQRLYKANIEELLLPAILTKNELDELVKDPSAARWKDDQELQAKLEDRLRGSYDIYQDVMMRINDVTKELAKELSFDNAGIQDRLGTCDEAQPSPNNKAKGFREPFTRKNLSFQVFRVKFSLREPARDKLFGQLKDCNERLQQLVTSSDRLRSRQDITHTSLGSRATEVALKKIWRNADLLFRALQQAWQCSCSRSHIANLRVGHQAARDTLFELILMFTLSLEQCDNSSWSWQEVKCGHMPHCVHPFDLCDIPVPNQHAINATSLSPTNAIRASTLKRPTIRFADTPASIRLCEGLTKNTQRDCMGVITHEDCSYHLHPFTERKHLSIPARLTLNDLLSGSWTTAMTRSRRLRIAYLVASAVAQVSSTPWLRSKLEKDDIIFFFGGDAEHLDQPFLHQTFHGVSDERQSPQTSDFAIPSLGILLIELCFGQRLEDCKVRKKHPPGDAQTKPYIDQIAAGEWSQKVWEEVGDDYANAVQWCLDNTRYVSKNWRSEIHGNVVRPLERCLAYFKMGGVIESF